MKNKHIYTAFLFGAFLFWGCSEEDDIFAVPFVPEVVQGTPPPVNYTSGTADFSTYVAVGNSLTAGFSDNALFIRGQATSFPNIMAQQFALAGGGDFSQPLMNDDLGGLLLGGNEIADTRLIFDAANQVPVNISGDPTTEVSNVLSGPFNNMGVPGAKSYHLLANGYGNVAGVAAGLANPYFARMASSPNASVMEDAMAQNPTFFSLWIGSNDILGYAVSGGSGEDHNFTGNLDAATYAGNDITNAGVFAQVYNGLLATLTAGGAEGIVANLPNVTDAPYFTTVPHAPLDPTNPNFGPQIPTLNTVFGAMNQVFAFLGVPERSVVFSENSASAVVIRDETLTDLSVQIAQVLNADPNFPLFVQQFGLPPQAAPLVANLFGAAYGQVRQATAEDLLVLPSRNVIGGINQDSFAFLQSQGLSPELAAQFSAEGITYALDDQWVLIPSEQTAIVDATVAFNTTIAAAAEQFDLAFFDANAFLNTVATTGVPIQSIDNPALITADFVTGGAFSLDGVHPSPRGYAVAANQMIGIINDKYGSNLPEVDPVEFTGLYLN